jgi:O-acetyl-ADP-ribose deacetylase (regulator of RNase III)
LCVMSEQKRQLPPKDELQTFNANGHPFKVMYGNLLNMAKSGAFDVIVHGCNCHCNFGAGLAKDVKEMWPAAYAADLATKKADRSKMGTFSFAEVDGLTIVNLYTQYNYTRDKVDVEYEFMKAGFEKVKEAFSGKRIGLPMIGAGLAKGYWGIIKEIIGDAFAGEDVTVVIFKK